MRANANTSVLLGGMCHGYRRWMTLFNTLSITLSVVLAVSVMAVSMGIRRYVDEIVRKKAAAGAVRVNRAGWRPVGWEAGFEENLRLADEQLRRRCRSDEYLGYNLWWRSESHYLMLEHPRERRGLGTFTRLGNTFVGDPEAKRVSEYCLAGSWISTDDADEIVLSSETARKLSRWLPSSDAVTDLVGRTVWLALPEAAQSPPAASARVKVAGVFDYLRDGACMAAPGVIQKMHARVLANANAMWDETYSRLGYVVAGFSSGSETNIFALFNELCSRPDSSYPLLCWRVRDCTSAWFAVKGVLTGSKGEVLSEEARSRVRGTEKELAGAEVLLAEAELALERADASQGAGVEMEQWLLAFEADAEQVFPKTITGDRNASEATPCLDVRGVCTPLCEDRQAQRMSLRRRVSGVWEARFGIARKGARKKQVSGQDGGLAPGTREERASASDEEWAQLLTNLQRQASQCIDAMQIDLSASSLTSRAAVDGFVAAVKSKTEIHKGVAQQEHEDAMTRRDQAAARVRSLARKKKEIAREIIAGTQWGFPTGVLCRVDVRLSGANTLCSFSAEARRDIPASDVSSLDEFNRLYPKGYVLCSPRIWDDLGFDAAAQRPTDSWRIDAIYAYLYFRDLPCAEKARGYLDGVGFQTHMPIDDFKGILSLVRVVIWGAQALFATIMFAGALGIAVTLYAEADAEAAEVGLLKALGASSRRVGGLFLLKGTVIGGIGVVVGVPLAMFVSKIVERTVAGAVVGVAGIEDVGGMSFAPGATAILAISAAVVALSSAAALFPAVLAARRDPQVALRDE